MRHPRQMIALAIVRIWDPGEVVQKFGLLGKTEEKPTAEIIGDLIQQAEQALLHREL